MQEAIVQQFQALAAIDSPSGQEGALAAKVAATLKANGFTVRRDSMDNLIARSGPGEPLLLCCHLDTVESTAGLELVLEGDYIRSGGATILGADDKAGIAVILACPNALEKPASCRACVLS